MLAEHQQNMIRAKRLRDQDGSMTSDNGASAYGEDENLDVPQRKRSHSRYSSRHKNSRRADKNSRYNIQDGYSTTSAAGGFRNESEFDDEVANSSTYGFYQGNADLQQNKKAEEMDADQTVNNPQSARQENNSAAYEYKPPMKQQTSNTINEGGPTEETKEV